MDKFTYILTKQETKMIPKIYSFWNTYEEAVIAFHDYHLKHSSGFADNNNNRKFFDIELYKFPVGMDLSYGKSSSDTKLGKSSEYRVKFKDWNELKQEYKSVNRNFQIDSLVG